MRNQLHALTHKPTIIATVCTRMEQLIETLTQQLQAVEAELETALSADPNWVQTAQRLQTISGIGPLTAAWLLVTTLNFTLCENAEALTAYAGLAPHPSQSGTSVHGRDYIGHSGNGRLRTVLYLATLSAAQNNPVIKTFYERLCTAGKPKKVALCAAARTLLHLAYVVVTHMQDARSPESVRTSTTALQSRVSNQELSPAATTRGVRWLSEQNCHFFS
jgi:transposase